MFVLRCYLSRSFPVVSGFEGCFLLLFVATVVDICAFPCLSFPLLSFCCFFRECLCFFVHLFFSLLSFSGFLLQATQARGASHLIQVLSADITQPEGRQAILNTIPADQHIAFLVHNASILNIGLLTDISIEHFRQQLAIDVEAPLFLTQTLLPKMSQGARILHISTGCAHKAVVGMGAYCVSKAALYRMYAVLKEEFRFRGLKVHIGSVRPGQVGSCVCACV